MSVGCSIVSHPFAQQFIQHKSRQLCRRSGFSRSDADDLRQDMTAHVWAKSPAYDARRGNPEAFITMLANSWAAMCLRGRGRAKRRPATPVVSLEWKGEGDNTIRASLSPDDGGRRLGVYSRPASEEPVFRDLVAAIYARTSPDERAFLMGVADRGVAGVARALGRTRRDVQRDLNVIRARFGVILSKSCAASSTAA